MVVTLRREEAEEVLSAAFWIFEVADCIQVVEADLFEKTLLGGGFVEREQVGSEDEVEGFPLLRRGALAECKSWFKVVGNLGFPGAFMHLSTSKHTIKGEAAILIHGRKGVEIEVPTSDAWSAVGQSR